MSENIAALLPAFDRLSDGICLTSRGRIVYMNAAAARLLGVARDQAVGGSLCELLCRHVAAPGNCDCALRCGPRGGAGAENDVSFEGHFLRLAFDWHDLRIERIERARDLRVRCLKTELLPDANLPDVRLTLIEDASPEGPKESSP